MASTLHLWSWKLACTLDVTTNWVKQIPRCNWGRRLSGTIINLRAGIAFLKTEGLAGCYQGGELRGFDEVAVSGMFTATGCGNGERQETPEELQDSKSGRD